MGYTSSNYTTYGGGGGYGGYYGYGGNGYKTGYAGDGSFYDGVDYVMDEFMVYGNNDGFGNYVDFGYFGDFFSQDSFYNGYTLQSYSDGSDEVDYSDNDSSIYSVFRHPDAMEGSSWRQNKLPPIQKKRQNVMDGTLMRALIQGEGKQFIQTVYDGIKDHHQTDPNSFAANTWLAPNGKTYELPPASEDAIGTENEFASRIQNFVGSFDYLRMYNRNVAQRPEGMGEDGVFAGFVGENLDSNSYQEFLNSSKYFPQVLNQAGETISRDGTIISYPDGSTFNVDFGDVTNFTPGNASGFDANQLSFETDPSALSGQYSRFYNGFIDQHIENWRLGNDWTTLSIGYDGSIYGENGYDQNGYNRQGHDNAGYDRDGFHYEGYNQNGLDASGEIWRDEEGYDVQGYDISGFDIQGLDVNNRDVNGYDLDGRDFLGYDRDGYDGGGRDALGYDRAGFDNTGYNEDGYDINGLDRLGFNADGFNQGGFNSGGFNTDGFNESGFNELGFNLEGYNAGGFDSFGYDLEGYDQGGRDVLGYDRDGYDVYGYNEDGYNSNGYDNLGFNEQGLNDMGYNSDGFDTDGYNLTGFNSDGYNIDGYNQGGYNPDGYDSDGYNAQGFNAEGYDREGYAENGFNSDGYNRQGFDADGYNADGFNADGYNVNNFDRLGYNSEGFNSLGYNSDGFDKDGFNADGFNADGYNKNGYNSDGYNSDGYNQGGYNSDGFNSDGYNALGFNPEGYNSEGYDNLGYNSNGFNSSGFNADGYNSQGFNNLGYNSSGYDSFGYDSEGYDPQGRDLLGYDVEGYDSFGYDSEGYDKQGYDNLGFNSNGYNASGFDSEGYTPEGYDDLGYDLEGFDSLGFDNTGYNILGFDNLGYDKDGFNDLGLDDDGYDLDGFNSAGFNSDGLDELGFNIYGFNENGLNIDGYNIQGYNSDGFNIDGYNASGYNEQGFNVDGFNPAGLDAEGYNQNGVRPDPDGYWYTKDGEVDNTYNGQVDPSLGGSYTDANGVVQEITPEIYSVADPTSPVGTGGGNGIDPSIDPGNVLDDPGGAGGAGGGDNTGGGGSAEPGTSTNTGTHTIDWNKLQEISSRYLGTRRHYNDFLRTQAGQQAATSVGDLLNKYMSPSEDDPLTRSDEFINKVLNIATANGFQGLDAFALSVNLLEGIVNTDLLDVPNMGFLINNIFQSAVPENVINLLEEITPDFMEKMTGLDNLFQNGNLPTDYLGQNFNLKQYLLADLGMASEVNYGLLPATENIQQQQIDFVTELLGPNVAPGFLADNDVTDLDFFKKAIDLAEDGGLGDEFNELVSQINNIYVGQGGEYIMTQEQFDEWEAALGEEPSLWNKLTTLTADGFGTLLQPFEGIGNLMESMGFYQQYYMGGALPTMGLNFLGAAAMGGFPFTGTLLNVLGDALAPSGQELSDWLQERGIDAHTATVADISAWLNESDVNYNTIPPFDPITGEFGTRWNGSSSTVDDLVSGIDLTGPTPEVNLGGDNTLVTDLTTPTPEVNLGGDNTLVTDLTDNFNFDTDNDGLFDTFISNLADFAGDNTLTSQLINGDLSITDGILTVVDNTISGIVGDGGGTGGDVVGGGGGGETVGGGEGGINPVPEVFPPNPEIDGGDNINPDPTPETGTNPGTMPETTTPGAPGLGDEYDIGYETAKYLIGAEAAERFRGLGMDNEELMALVDSYSSRVSQDELARLIELNRGEQAGINELRDVQKASDLELIGDYGTQYADAIRSLDPTSMSILGDQKALSDRLYRRAAGDLTAEEQTDAEERAFEIAAMSGRTLDSTRVANTIRSEEDFRTGLENRAQQAGSLGYNMSRNITGDIPGMLLGTGGSPYGTGVGQVVPPMGIGDAISAGVNSYAQQQNIQKAEAQIAQLQQSQAAAEASGDLTSAERFANTILEIQQTLNIANATMGVIGNIPDTISNTMDAGRSLLNYGSQAVSGITNFLTGGSRSTPSAQTFVPGSSFNVPSSTWVNSRYEAPTSFGGITFP